MQEYKFEIINARFIASGVAIQAKDSLTGCDRTKGGTRRKRGLQARDAARLRDGGGTTEGGAAINKAEEKWSGSGDYWLGRTALRTWW